MKKIIVSDYDGTFYKNGQDMKKNKLAVEQVRAYGDIFVLATGRSYVSIKEEIDKYKIKYHYLILCHGAVILKKNKIVKEYFLDEKMKEEIIELLKLREKKNYIFTSSLENVDILHPNITRIHVWFDTLEEAKQKQTLIQENYGSFVHCYLIESCKAIEIISNKTNKSVAIKKIGILENSKEIYTIGDGYNDICMIEDYHGAVMENAVEELKNKNYKEYTSVADFIKDVLESEK